MKTFFACSIIPGAIIGFSVLFGHIETVQNTTYPSQSVASQPSDDWILFSLYYIGGFGAAASLYSFLALKND